MLQKEEKLLLIEPLNLDCKIYPNSKMWMKDSLTNHTLSDPEHRLEQRGLEGGHPG